jgi:predicted transcriptional regulator
MDLKEARKILWKDYDALTDKEIQMVIDLIQSICQIVVEDYLSEKNS